MCQIRIVIKENICLGDLTGDSREEAAEDRARPGTSREEDGNSGREEEMPQRRQQSSGPSRPQTGTKKQQWLILTPEAENI
jgi:hypothetical protein